VDNVSVFLIVPAIRFVEQNPRAEAGDVVLSIKSMNADHLPAV
jgi:hypothetical protein